jgi:hypothetical protein
LYHFENYKKDNGRKYGFQTFGIHFIKNIVIVVIVRICLILNKLKYYDSNGGLPDRTTPAVVDIAVKSLPQNSAYAIFYDFRTDEKS